MDLLLDTHALLWWLHQPSSLSPDARDAIRSRLNRVYVSPVSAMEIATKHRRGRLEFRTRLAIDFSAEVAKEGFVELAVAANHAQVAGGFTSPHNDPWDRLLAAQARVEGLRLVSNDAAMPGFGIDILW